MNLGRGPQIISSISSGSENEEDTVEAIEVEERLGLVSYGTIQCVLTKGYFTYTPKLANYFSSLLARYLHIQCICSSMCVTVSNNRLFLRFLLNAFKATSSIFLRTANHLEMKNKGEKLVSFLLSAQI